MLCSDEKNSILINFVKALRDLRLDHCRAAIRALQLEFPAKVPALRVL